MSDHSELKKLAEATKLESINSVQRDRLIVHFQRAASPDAVLALIAEVEQAQLIGRISCNFDGYKAVLDERDQLKAEVERLKAFEEAYHTACSVRNRLIGDNEALRKDAERYRWLMSGAVMNGTLGIRDGWIDFEFKDEAAQQIDAAMGKGEKV